MVNKQLLLLVVGLIIASYAVLVMPPTTEDTDCISHEVTDDGPRCAEQVTTEEENKFRLPVAISGGTITLIGGILYLGDFV